MAETPPHPDGELWRVLRSALGRGGRPTRVASAKTLYYDIATPPNLDPPEEYGDEEAAFRAGLEHAAAAAPLGQFRAGGCRETNGAA